MLTYILLGGSLAFTAAVQPGPLQAYLLSRVAAVGWRRTMPAAFAPLLSDGPIAFLALVVLGRLSEEMQAVLRGTGGLFLLYLAWRSYTDWRRPPATASGPGGRTPGTLLEAAVVNLLNPNPYLGWALILGPLVVGAWQESPAYGIAVVVAFYAVMVVTLLAVIVAFGGARWFGPGLQRRLLLVSAIVLAGIGIYQLAAAARGLHLS